MDLLMEKVIIKIFKNHFLENGEMILDMVLASNNLKIKKENMLVALLAINIKEKENFLINNSSFKDNSKQVYFTVKV